MSGPGEGAPPITDPAPGGGEPVGPPGGDTDALLSDNAEVYGEHPESILITRVGSAQLPRTHDKEEVVKSFTAVIDPLENRLENESGFDTEDSRAYVDRLKDRRARYQNIRGDHITGEAAMSLSADMAASNPDSGTTGAFGGTPNSSDIDPSGPVFAAIEAEKWFSRAFGDPERREFGTVDDAKTIVKSVLVGASRNIKGRPGLGTTSAAVVQEVFIDGKPALVMAKAGDANLLQWDKDRGYGVVFDEAVNTKPLGEFDSEVDLPEPFVVFLDSEDIDPGELIAVTGGVMKDADGNFLDDSALNEAHGKMTERYFKNQNKPEKLATELVKGSPANLDKAAIAIELRGNTGDSRLQHPLSLKSRYRGAKNLAENWWKNDKVLFKLMTYERNTRGAIQKAKVGQVALSALGLGLAVYAKYRGFDFSSLSFSGVGGDDAGEGSIEVIPNNGGAAIGTDEQGALSGFRDSGGDTPSTPSTASSSTSTPTPSSTTTGVDVSGGGVDVFGGGVDASGSGSAESAAAGPSAGGETTGPGATDQGTGPSDADPAGATPEPEPTPELSENHTLEIAKGRGFEDAYEAELKASGAADGMTQQEVDDEAARIHQYMKLQHQATFDALKDAQLTYGEDLVSAPGELTVSEEFRNDLTEFTSGNKEVPTWEEIQEMRAEKAAEAADAATADADSGSGQSEQDGGGTTGPGVNDPGTGSTPEPEPEPEPTPEPAPELPAATPDNSLPNMDADTGRNSITGGFGALQGETDTQVLRDVYRYAEPTIAQIDAQYGPNSPFYFDEGEWRLNANAIDANGNIVITDTVLAKLNEAYGLIKNGNLSREEIDTLVAGQR